MRRSSYLRMLVQPWRDRQTGVAILKPPNATLRRWQGARTTLQLTEDRQDAAAKTELATTTAVEQSPTNQPPEHPQFTPGGPTAAAIISTGELARRTRMAPVSGAGGTLDVRFENRLAQAPEGKTVGASRTLKRTAVPERIRSAARRGDNHVEASPAGPSKGTTTFLTTAVSSTEGTTTEAAETTTPPPSLPPRPLLSSATTPPMLDSGGKGQKAARPAKLSTHAGRLRVQSAFPPLDRDTLQEPPQVLSTRLGMATRRELPVDSPRARLSIGSIEVTVAAPQPPPPLVNPQRNPSAALPTRAALARGYTTALGLRQG